jgi:hypothetical protein
MQTGDGAGVYAANGSHGKAAYGYGTRRQGLGSRKDRCAGKKGGECMEWWQMYPATRPRLHKMTLIERFRLWKRRRHTDDLANVKRPV